MIQLTPKQQQALDSTRHLAIVANAGSGKTHVLVERFLSIVLGGNARVSEVVAITFTEKAAAELRRKIAQAVAERLDHATDVATLKRLQTIRNELSSAVIDTIHSFCARLLRDYPVEADVDAAFTVLEEIDRTAMTEAAVRETFARILRQPPDDPLRQQMFEVVRRLGKKKTFDIVHEMVRKRELVDRWLASGGLYDRSDDELIHIWRSAVKGVARCIVEGDDARRDVGKLANAATMHDEVQELLQRYAGGKSLCERSDAFVQLTQKLLKGRGELRRRAFGEITSDLREAASRVARRAEMIRQLLPVLEESDEQAHRDLLRQARFFLELYREVVRRYTEAKEEGAYLDFDDLQLKTRDLLTNERICQKLAQRFKFIMVDEYQDTNLLQYEILLPLLSNLRRGNLCIVGDPKQSIYGFRDADVSVFHRTKDDIVKQCGRESVVTLDASFRLLRDIAAFINLLFSSIMAEAEDEFEVTYEPLVCARPNNAPGRVEVLLPPVPESAIEEESDDNNTEESGSPVAAVNEEEMIARRILQLVRSGYEVFDKQERPHPVRFRDIAILLRSRTGLGRLEAALLRHDIPHLVSGGVGYFQTQPIYDFYHYFCFLLNTYDDVALVGILRSPFFNVSDAELLEWRFAHRTGGWWETMRSAPLNEVRFPGIARAARKLADDLTLAYRLSVPELIDHIIETTGYAGFIAGTTRAEQMEANIEKLKRVARRYTERGFTDLYDFTKRLQRLIDEYQEEGQATVDVDADAVRIMTIHAAKGLEFPVVFIPSLDRQFRDDVSCYLDQQVGLGFVSTSETPTPIVALMRQRAKRRTDAEEKRILYVACTRARDLLVLSSSKRNSGSSRSCWAWLQNLLRLESQTTASTKNFEVTTDVLVPTNGRFECRNIRHNLPVHLVYPHELSTSGATGEAQQMEQTKLVNICIEPIGAAKTGEFFSATKIRTYLQCPSKYYLRYVVGLPASSVRLFRDNVEDEEDVEIPRDLRGRAFHHVMQHSERIGANPAAILTELKNFISRDSYSILSEPSIELEALTEKVMAVLRSKFWQNVLSGTDTRTEFTIMTRIDHDILLGTLDRIYRDHDGVWTVLDFKTDTVDSETLARKQAEYEAQLKFYSLLVRKYFGADRVQSCLLFSELPEHPVQAVYLAGELEAFEQELRLIISRIRAREFSRPGPPCVGCPFLPSGCRF